MLGRTNIRNRWPAASALLLLSLSLSAASAHAAEATLRIYRYAAFNDQSLVINKSSEAASSPRQRAKINVYGKQLALSLENNARLIDNLPVNRVQTTVLRGVLEDKPRSWVRLTKTAHGTHGLIWDGTDMYAVEPSEEVRAALAVSLPIPSSDTVIFKLSDTTVDLGADYCGAEAHNDGTAHTGLATYQALASDLTPAVTDTQTATLRLEMIALADAAFRAQYHSDQEALDAIVVRLNNVDGIFTSQMGLEIEATDIQIYSADPAALSTSTSADTLLSSLGQLRNSTPGMSSYGATHLFTGRDLDGDTLGIAYIGNICGARYGASLSEIRNRGAWIDSLVAAHELGHQLGAVHDGTGACSSTPAQSYLMGAQINGYSELSQCSRDSILATMQHSACLVPVGVADVTTPTSNAANASAEPTSSQGGGGAMQPIWLALLLLLAGTQLRRLRRCTQPLL